MIGRAFQYVEFDHTFGLVQQLQTIRAQVAQVQFLAEAGVALGQLRIGNPRTAPAQCAPDFLLN